jgi:hypothetical protein
LKKQDKKQVLEIKVKLGEVEVFYMWGETRKDAYSTVCLPISRTGIWSLGIQARQPQFLIPRWRSGNQRFDEQNLSQII